MIRFDNLIQKGEDFYGLLNDFKRLFKSAYKEDGEYKDTFLEAILDIDKLMENEENLNNIYKCWYNPMGAYIFTPVGKVD